jgi:hypothetical protein
MTYNNYIFKTMWEEIIEKLIEHSTFEDIDSYNIYFDFIQKVFSSQLNLDKR